MESALGVLIIGLQALMMSWEFASQAMAPWFLGSAARQGSRGAAHPGMGDLSVATYDLVNGVMTLFLAAILFALVPWIRRRMASVEIGAEGASAAH